MSLIENQTQQFEALHYTVCQLIVSLLLLLRHKPTVVDDVYFSFGFIFFYIFYIIEAQQN